jgi:hypothetical protein
MTASNESSGNNDPNLAASERDPEPATIHRLLGVIDIAVAAGYSSAAGPYPVKGYDFRYRELPHPDFDGGVVELARYIYATRPEGRRVVRQGYVNVSRDTGNGTGRMVKTNHDILDYSGKLVLERKIPLPDLPREEPAGHGTYFPISEEEMLGAFIDYGEAFLRQARDEASGLSRVTEQTALDLINLVQRSTLSD